MKKRLFFDRVDVTSDKFTVIQAKEGAAAVFPYPANAAFPVSDKAVEIAQIAIRFTALALFPESRFAHKSILADGTFLLPFIRGGRVG